MDDSPSRISGSYLQKFLVFADIKQLNVEVESNSHFERLVNAFPTVEKNITRSILLASRGDLAPAFNALLSLTCEDIQLGLPMRRYEYLPDRGLMERALKGKQEEVLDQLLSQNKEEGVIESSSKGSEQKKLDTQRSEKKSSDSKKNKKPESFSNKKTKPPGTSLDNKAHKREPTKPNDDSKATKQKGVAMEPSDQEALKEKLSQSVKSGKQKLESNSAQHSEEVDSKSVPKSGTNETKAKTVSNPYDLLATDENEDDHSVGGGDNRGPKEAD
ncbi:Don1p RNJ42_01668 [Nakaseomyces bracarensis]|uniref:Don1p n=1 Tax=Nakaseomyces bracarensis TaxID=273131 RepID=UPI003872917F